LLTRLRLPLLGFLLLLRLLLLGLLLLLSALSNFGSRSLAGTLTQGLFHWP
jgi:hypothetical protein